VRARFSPKEVQIISLLETLSVLLQTLSVTLCFTLRIFREVFDYPDDT